jgi:kynurenine formamidase
MTTTGLGEISAQDTLVLSPHGFEMTHLDAVGHVFLDGEMYNGRRADRILSSTGLSFGAISAMRDGILTRCVFLDVATVRRSARRRLDQAISVADLERAEDEGGVGVGSGDAIVVRGRANEIRVPATHRVGILPEVLKWLRRRDVAVYSGDCIEDLPSPYATLPMPLHQIGLAAMGLCILDCPNVDSLAAATERFGTNEFLLVVAPLRIPGGTGSAVNPLAIF